MRIMGTEYEVIHTNLLMEHGGIQYEEKKILIDSASSEAVQQETLLHEAMHGILYETGLHFQLAESPGLEESIVRAIETGLKQAGFIMKQATDRE